MGNWGSAQAKLDAQNTQVNDTYRRMLNMDFYQLEGICSPSTVHNNIIIEKVCTNPNFWFDYIRHTYRDFPNLDMKYFMSWVMLKAFAREMTDRNVEDAITLYSLRVNQDPVFMAWFRQHPELLHGGQGG